MNKTYFHYMINSCIKIATDEGLIKRPKTFNKKLAVTFHSRAGCFGGVIKKIPIITFGANCPWLKNDVSYFPEYKAIRKSKAIGEIKTNRPSLIHKAVVAHELAHAIQFWNGNPGKPHGRQWKLIYKAIREVWVNPFIDC